MFTQNTSKSYHTELPNYTYSFPHIMYVQYQTYGYILTTHPFTRCRLTSVYRPWFSRTENNLQYFSRGPDIATDTTPQTRSTLGDTMIRLLAVALSQKNPFFHSVETGVIDSGPAEPKIFYSISPGPDLPTDATPRTRSVLGGPSPRRGHASGIRRIF